MRAKAASLRDRVLWYRRSHKSLVVAAMGLTCCVVSLMPWLPRVVLLLVGIAGLLLALVSFAWENSALNRRFRETELGERRPVFPGRPPHDDDLPDRFSTDFGTILHDRRLDASLRTHGSTWTVELRSGNYRLPEELADIAPFVLRRTTGGSAPFNGPCMRMAGDCRLDGSRVIPLERAGFFDHLCSNELMKWRLCRNNEDWDVRRRFLHDGEGRLVPLASSPLANIIGVSTLAISEDQQVLVLDQSNANHASGGLTAPSGSGSLEPQDWDPADTSLAGVMMRGANRELIEETGIPADLILSSHLVGFGRWLERGGKPEFFGVTLLRGTAAEVDRARHRVTADEKRRVRRTTWLPLTALLSPDDERSSFSSLPLAFSVDVLAKTLEGSPEFLQSGGFPPESS